MQRTRLTLLAATLLILALPSGAHAQDSFELEVYGHETTAPREWELESHLAFSGQGTIQFDGAVAPTNHQLHLAVEVAHGLSRHWELAAYGLFARQVGRSPEYAGWRLRSRASSPKSWQLPVDLALNLELSYTRPVFDDHTYALEITPIVSRGWGPVRIDLNAALERPLTGADRGQWEFEPSVKAAVTVGPAMDLTVEYFSALGPLTALDPVRKQVHQLYPGLVLRLGDEIAWSAGVGYGLTASGDRVVAKTALEVEL